MATKEFLAWVERQAQQLRGKLALQALDLLDPYLLARRMKALVLAPAQTPGLSDLALDQLLSTSSNGWSGGGVLLPNGRVAIVLNPSHADTRKRATLMEELAHVHLGHKPSQLIVMGDRVAVRSFSKSQETAAYWVGSAALIPKLVLLTAQTNSVTRAALASRYGVSVALIGFRERVTGTKL